MLIHNFVINFVLIKAQVTFSAVYKNFNKPIKKNHAFELELRKLQLKNIRI